MLGPLSLFLYANNLCGEVDIHLHFGSNDLSIFLSLTTLR